MHSASHMIKYHLLLPAAALLVLLLAGVSLPSAASAAVSLGCVAMMAMMGWMAVAAVLRVTPHDEVREEASEL